MRPTPKSAPPSSMARQIAVTQPGEGRTSSSVNARRSPAAAETPRVHRVRLAGPALVQQPDRVPAPARRASAATTSAVPSVEALSTTTISSSPLRRSPGAASADSGPLEQRAPVVRGDDHADHVRQALLGAMTTARSAGPTEPRRLPGGCGAPSDVVDRPQRPGPWRCRVGRRTGAPGACRSHAVQDGSWSWRPTASTASAGRRRDFRGRSKRR